MVLGTPLLRSGVVSCLTLGFPLSCCGHCLRCRAQSTYSPLLEGPQLSVSYNNHQVLGLNPSASKPRLEQCESQHHSLTICNILVGCDDTPEVGPGFHILVHTQMLSEPSNLHWSWPSWLFFLPCVSLRTYQAYILQFSVHTPAFYFQVYHYIQVSWYIYLMNTHRHT